mmetsp:Transcript_3981/g.8803  ORF Transcript_3981/g.8803 Transcript_3981/m.8803 type:complete len:1045 (+) Transcript_3981:92-3226(+)
MAATRSAKTMHMLLAAAVAIISGSSTHAFSPPNRSGTGKSVATAANSISSSRTTHLRLAVEPPPGGITATADETEEGTTRDDGTTTPSGGGSNTNNAAESTKRVGINSRGAKMNEIDFTLAPSDVSLSRCYQTSGAAAAAAAAEAATSQSEQSVQSLSLTRALNTASNRAVRRILLSRSWPSAEALNLSLRTVLMQQRKEEEEAEAAAKAGLASNGSSSGDDGAGSSGGEDGDKMKCPVPRPILNILTNRRGEDPSSADSASATASNNADGAAPAPRIASSEERERAWIENQIAVFRESYALLPGYDQAEAYLVSVLSLATSGEESPRVDEVMVKGGTYVEPYVRILSVIQSVGAVLEEIPHKEGAGESSSGSRRRRIAKKLIDQDICLSMLDKIALANERKKGAVSSASGNSNGNDVREEENPVAIPYDAAARLAYDADPANRSVSFEEFKPKYESETVAMVTAKTLARKLKPEEGEQSASMEKTAEEEGVKEEEPKGAHEKGRMRRLKFWSREKRFTRDKDSKEFVRVPDKESKEEVEASSSDDATTTSTSMATEIDDDVETPIIIKPDDLGAVLLSAEEPTMTRQLNVLSNIVQRTLIFGGDQELLVLAETLDADKPAFVQRWYKEDDAGNNSNNNDNIATETRPGVQYLNSLIQLLRDCYTKGVLRDVTPALPLTPGYQNAYGRLTASLIELGSGYVRPSPSSGSPLSLAMTTTAATAKYLTSTAPPKSAREELGRFAKWESAVRKNRENPYPDDLVGTWDVQDVVGTQTIGTSEVVFKPQGELMVKPPMQGLRWRLDPGPTHLDTCTFQVLSDDGAILQYKGFVDRGSRLEARVSKRSVTMRGGVSFLMRDADYGGNVGDDYWDDMVPMNYKSGTTKFIMSRNVNSNGDGMGDSSSATSNAAGLQAPLKCPPIAEGEREILNGPNGPILVTRVAGSYYAVDATCPHLNLPMKRGKISVDEDTKQPTLTCSFHNSCFELKSGKCTKWVTGALGSQNDVIAGIMGSVGGERKDIVSYAVSEEGDGTLVVVSDITEMSKIEV